MKKITVAICTYNRAERLTPLIESLRRQESPIPFEILIVDNNSIDNTQEVLAQLAQQAGPPLRFVVERQQGILYARINIVANSKERGKSCCTMAPKRCAEHIKILQNTQIDELARFRTEFGSLQRKLKGAKRGS